MHTALSRHKKVPSPKGNLTSEGKTEQHETPKLSSTGERKGGMSLCVTQRFATNKQEVGSKKGRNKKKESNYYAMEEDLGNNSSPHF